MHQSVPESFLLERGLTNYWGYNTIGFFAPNAAYSASVRAGAPPGARWPSSRRWCGRCTRPAWTSCSMWSTTTRRRPARTGPRCASAGWTTLPTTDWTRPCDVRRHDGVRQLPRRRQPDVPPAHDGLAAVLGRRHGRRRLSLRPRRDPGTTGRRLRPRPPFFDLVGQDPVLSPGEADRRAVGRRPATATTGQVPRRLERVERPIPRHRARLLARPRRPCSATWPTG